VRQTTFIPLQSKSARTSTPENEIAFQHLVGLERYKSAFGKSSLAEKLTLLEMTAEIVAVHVANNSVSVGDVVELIHNVHAALSSIGCARNNVQTGSSISLSALRASVKDDYIICLKCGNKHQVLRGHLRSAHGLGSTDYRQLYRLPENYPLVAPNYSRRRSAIAKSFGFGRR
jgi:predicted transcriptional regulator